jgi:4-amino-4-deoxy-L-arabinose transferase-like glycosyltransferase
MPELLQAAGLLLGVALAVGLLAVTAFVLGRLLTGELERPVERWAVPAALGLALLAHLGFFLGLAGLLRPLPVLGVAAVIHLLGFRVWRGGPPLRRPFWRHAVLAVLALFPFVLLALYPPTAFDATLYHLPYAKGFVASGGIPFLRDLRFPVFPQVNEMLFALVLLFAPDLAAHGVQWLLTMLTAALVWEWGRDAFGERPQGGSGVMAGWLAAAIFLGSPLVAYLAGTGYIEAGLTLFATAAFYSVRRWRLGGERRWLALAAVFAATAADVKYIGLFFLGVIGLAVLCGRLPRRPLRGRLAAAALFTLVGCAVLAPWYGRIYAWTGNPVFPFFPQVFGGGPWAPLRFRSFLLHPTGSGPAEAVAYAEALGSRLLALVRLPWDVAVERARYNGEPPVSPLFVAALPLALVAAFRDGRQRRLLGLAALYSFVCLGLPPDARYLVPALPLVSLAAAGVLLGLPGRLEARRRPIPRWTPPLAVAAALACFLPGWLYPFYRASVQGPPPLTPAGREAYLARRQPLYPAVAFLNRTRGSAYALWADHAENMAYYARGRFEGDWIGLARFDRMLGGLQGPADFHARLRGVGADHLLLPAAAPALPFPEDAAFQRWFSPVYADPNARVYRLR